MVRTIEAPLYTTTATVHGGRSGHARTDDGLLDLELTAPTETGGPGTGTNPEQLFAAGYAACFQSAMSSVAKTHGIDAGESVLVAEVTLGKAGDGGYGLGVALRGRVPGVDAATTQRLMDETHQVCPYSRAIDGNVAVTLGVLEAEPTAV